MSDRYDLGPAISDDGHYALLRHVLDTCDPTGTAVEFGVGEGESTRIIAVHMPVIGFDSFQGLPEFWRPEFPKGSFACDPPEVDNCTLVIGRFDKTLPTYSFAETDIGLVHFDADLYRSTATALEYVGPHLFSGCFLVFDEWYGYEGCERHEQRAFKNYAYRRDWDWTVLGHGDQQWAVRLS